MTTTTTDTRDNINVRPGIEFEPGRAEVRGYSQQNKEIEQTKSEGFDNNLSVAVSVPPLCVLDTSTVRQ